MARPLKKGIDYFSFDVDFFDDEKIEPISGEFGGKGELIVIRLLCAVYRNGYFIVWNEQLKLSLANRCKVSSDLIEQVINRLAKWGFIDEALFNSAKIITSKGIQKRFQEATRKRKYNYFSFDYWLLGDERRVTSVHNKPQEELSSTITPQSKVKESKVNKSKDINKDNSKELLRETSQPHTENINYEELVIFFNEKTKGVFGNLRLPLSEKRKGHLRARFREHGKESFIEIVEKAMCSDFLKGSSGKWTAKFDWMILPTNYEKILSGNYDNTKKSNETSTSILNIIKK